jgi:hypothetical protein
MSWGEEFMVEARAQVAARARSVSHKISTLAWYTGRKQIRHAPKTVLQSAGGLIPVPLLGSVFNAAVEAAVTKVDSDRKAKKRAKYANYASAQNLSSLRKAAKADAKDLKTLAATIDGNQVKLKDAQGTQRSAMDGYFTAVRAGTVTKDHIWKAALAIYERERYEDKILVLVETARAGLKAIEDYVASSRAKTAELEEEFIEELDAIEDELLPRVQAPRNSVTAYGRLN